MEHELTAPHDARVVAVLAREGELVSEGDVLMQLERAELAVAAAPSAAAGSGTARAARRPAASARPPRAHARRRARPKRSQRRHGARRAHRAREHRRPVRSPAASSNTARWRSPRSARRRSHDDLVRNTPADGMVTGIGSINAEQFGAERSRCRRDGLRRHRAGRHAGPSQPPEDRPHARHRVQQRLPVVLFAEGGGGRPGDTDMPIVAGLHVTTFASYARLSGQVPVIGIVAGRCFAGNAALLGCSDVIIATRASNIGMGGPGDDRRRRARRASRPKRSARAACSRTTA